MTDESLTTFVENVCGTSHLRVEDDLGDGFVRLLSSEAERRQAQHDIRSTEDIIIEMLRNARDAHAKNIFVATHKEGDVRHIVMVDDGDGIPDSMHERIFEPRVTSKLDTIHMDTWGVHGRGMALFSIATNTEEARVVASDSDKGSALVIKSNTRKLPEKTDQSTFPVASVTPEGKITFRGPKNILRTICEFSFTHRKECSVYCGSTTDIAATLYAYGKATLTSHARLFGAQEDEFPLCKRLCLNSDPESFVECAARLGLMISERSARRILDGQIKPLGSMYEMIALAVVESTQDKSEKARGASKEKQNRGSKLKISPDDIHVFEESVHNAFDELADRYYLQRNVAIETQVKSDGLHIVIPFQKTE